MMNNGNYNINSSDDNSTRNPPPPTLEHVMAIQGQLFQTTLLMQQTILQMQSTDERTQSRKRKIDTQGDASRTLDERTEKQLKIFVAQQVDYDKKIRRLSEISHDYMDFFGIVPPSLIGEIQCTTCGNKKKTSFWCLLEAVHMLYSLWALWPQFKELPDEEVYPFRVRELVVLESSQRWHS
jgi:hypothetical protein